jgi:hypothetical protein
LPSRKITQADVDEAVGRLNARRAIGIEASTNHLYSLVAIQEAISKEDENISLFEDEIEKAELRRRDLKKLLRDQEDIQTRLAAGEFVPGYSREKIDV